MSSIQKVAQVRKGGAHLPTSNLCKCKQLSQSSNRGWVVTAKCVRNTDLINCHSMDIIY